MAEIVAHIQRLQSLPAETHWFCPRKSTEEQHALFFDEDVDHEETQEEKTTRKARIKEAHDRKALFFEAAQILAFDGADALPYQQSLADCLRKQLVGCNICVREYHRARGQLQTELQTQYEADQVSAFMQRFDKLNMDRIGEGLDAAKLDMLDLEPAQRRINQLSQQGLYALFESMHCLPVLYDESFLSSHLDEPFRLVQTKQKIYLPECTPALAAFLFSANTERQQWALRGWQKFKRDITGVEFDAAVKVQLEFAMRHVPITALQKDFMPRFWKGVHAILTRLDRYVITHHLRAMETDLCKLSLDHMQVESPCFQDMLSSLQILFDKAPLEVWDALGAISPATVVEQIFNSPNFDNIMQTATQESLEQIFAWVLPFVRSIKPGSQGSACRGLLHQVLSRMQQKPYPPSSRTFAQTTGLQALEESFTTASSSGSVSGTAVSDLLNVLQPHLPTITANASNRNASDLGKVSLAVLAKALSADIRLLSNDRDAIMQKQSPAPDSKAAASALWSAALKIFKAEDTELAATITRACQQSIILQPISKKESEKNPKEAALWSQRFDEKCGQINELLEKIQDFEGEALGLYLEDGGESLVTLLFAGNKETQQAAASALRSVTSESSRRDAVRFMLFNYYRPTLLTLTEAFTTIIEAGVFLPSTMIIKVGSDFLQALCDSQDGILRSKSLEQEDSELTEAIWETFWDAIKMIFDRTEEWSYHGHDKDTMMEFCRDAMDFAAQTFDVYSVISGVLHATTETGDARLETDMRLLAAPAQASQAIVKWLRLRDEYLIAKAVSLICKLLGRLQEVNLELPADVLKFIEEIITDKIRHKVPAAQKAALKQGLNLKIEEVIVTSSRVIPQASQKKQGSISDWYSSGSSTPATASNVAPRKTSGIDFAGWKAKADQTKVDSSKNLDRMISSVSPTLSKLRESGYLASKPKPIVPSQTAQVSEFLRKRREAQEALAKKRREAQQVSRGLGNAGSGLSGLGIEGKDHSTKGQGVMVSSDEDSDDDSDDAELEALFGASAVTKRKDTVRSDAARALGLKPEVKPTRIQRQVRTKKDMRARLAPNLTPLYRIILSWDFFHDGDYPPNADEWNYRKVASSFRHIQDYRDTFQPLLTLEAWQGFVKAREEETFKAFPIKIANRVSVDGFIEISTALTHGDLREIQVAEGDIILLSTATKPATSPEAPHCLARVNGIKRKGKTVEVIYRVMQSTPLTSALTPDSLIHGAKVQSIIPLEREFGVLIGLEYYDLCDEIIKAKPSPLLTYMDKQLDPLIANYNVNKAQAKAIRSALDNDAFTLIQGPPGSGKTKTITAIVGALLSDSLSSNSGTTRITAPGANGNSDIAAKKLLVCAPSNAAVDELVMRFKDGVKTTRGVHKKINVVRVGRSEAVNSAVVDVTLEELVNRKLGKVNGSDNSAREHTQKLMMEHKNVSDTLREARDRMDGPNVKADEKPKLQDEINQLRRRKTELGNQIDVAKDAENAAGRTADLHRKRVQQSIIEDSHVICATLSGSGHQLFQELNVEFETVIVDEAAQCVEMSALIPLKYGCAKCILVGDPKQLPPTVFSKEAAKFQYEQSLFVRMQSNFPEAVHLLDTQYRMHPDISEFPSATFYDGRLLDGGDMAELRKRVWHDSSLLAPYRFFDVEGQHESAPKGHSLVNRAEINVALALYERLISDFRDYDFNNKIGIITPYKSQLRLLKETFASRYGNAIMERVEFNTTDAFQGRESEIIIFSCVRASPAGNIGFLQDIRRMNVGLTRAKCSLWVLGNSNSLVRGQFWKKLVEDAKARDLYTGGNLMSMLQQPSSKFPAKPRAKQVKQIEPAAAPVKAAQTNGADKKPPVTKIVQAKPAELDMFKTSGPPVRSVKTEVKAEVKTEAKTSDPRIKTETPADPRLVKKEIGTADPRLVKKENGTADPRLVKKENAIADPRLLKKENGTADPRPVKKEPLPADAGHIKKDRAEIRSGTTTPQSVTASEASRGTTPSVAPQQPPRVVVKRKAPGGVFLPKKKR